MATKMLIDARHPEETRVAVVKGNRIEEFDFEASARKQIKGNIYLAKITRVEPSLQAAFVDYGGNRHGFLAFSEIHPDYYQIPKEDREALLREERRIAEEHGAAEDARARAEEEGEAAESEAEGADGDDEQAPPLPAPEEHGGGDEAGAEALRRRRMALRRRYKIQEVIRRRQVMLVQVVKEERGNKGAALTTYISLAGRYSVLMPNTAQGGGISRKIANAADRKRLKAIIEELDLPSTMGAIVRTAGLERTKAEIKRDFDYLARLWDEIRESTLSSSAPALIYEDSDLVKRAIRDIYDRDIEEVLVDGSDGYTQAKAFMKLLMPSHARKVQLYAEAVPLFHDAGVEAQLAQLLNPVVTLKSGGYLVINSTEALVAIDVNSGRSTREYNIEETALKTNLEAAEEVARQLRLRDLAGLVVVDFIDMEVHGNNRKVERALKDALKRDRARIQVGRISPFGLLEMSRQRLRTGVLEATTAPCPVCDGTGLVRTAGSAALAALRSLEEEAAKGRGNRFRLRADQPVAIYVLNRKRAELAELEARYGVAIEVIPDAAFQGGRYEVDASQDASAPAALAPQAAVAAPEAGKAENGADARNAQARPEHATREDEEAPERPAERGGERNERGGERGSERSKRRRRGGRNRRGRDHGDDRGDGRSLNGAASAESPAAHEDAFAEAEEDAFAELPAATSAEASADAPVVAEAATPDEGEHEEGRPDAERKRRPRRRGGRRTRTSDGAEERAEGGAEERAETDSGAGEPAPAAADTEAGDEDAAPVAAEAVVADAADGEAPAPVKKPARRRTSRATGTKAASTASTRKASGKAKKAEKTEAADEKTAADAEGADGAADAAPRKRRRVTRAKKADAPATAAAKPDAPAADAPTAEPVAAEAPAPDPIPDAAPSSGDAPAEPATEPADASGESPRRGWWQRTFGG